MRAVLVMIPGRRSEPDKAAHPATGSPPGDHHEDRCLLRPSRRDCE